MRKVRHAKRSEIATMSPKEVKTKYQTDAQESKFAPVQVHLVRKPMILAGLLPKQGAQPLSPGKLYHDYKPHQGVQSLSLVKLYNGGRPHQGIETSLAKDDQPTLNHTSARHHPS